MRKTINWTSINYYTRNIAFDFTGKWTETKSAQWKPSRIHSKRTNYSKMKHCICFPVGSDVSCDVLTPKRFPEVSDLSISQMFGSENQSEHINQMCAKVKNGSCISIGHITNGGFNILTLKKPSRSPSTLHFGRENRQDSTWPLLCREYKCGFRTKSIRPRLTSVTLLYHGVHAKRVSSQPIQHNHLS